MKYIIILILLLCAKQQGHSQEQVFAHIPYSAIIVKKKTAGKICDTCRVDFAFHAAPNFSYVITGAGHTPQRFSHLRQSYNSLHGRIAVESTLHFISQRNIGISFLPNFLQEKGKRTQLYRDFGVEDYNNLEFRAQQNGRIIRHWTPLSALGEDRDYAILGSKEVSDQTISMPWKRTFFAGSFNLNINDSLDITVRNVRTKKILQDISIIRPVDKATNFVYYQVPLTGNQLSLNVQEILNISSDIPKVYQGDSVKVFWKDYASIGLIRFLGLGRNEVVQYSFEKKPYIWKSVSSINSENGVFIVLGNDMQAGTYQHIYLRYKSQPETIHRIRLLIKKKPLEIPWGKIAAGSILLLATVGIAFYLWNKKNEKKLSSLKRKNEDIEIRLSLLSGQLNPHFLFNSLNAIQGSINSNPEKANTYIANVARFMRDVMDNGKKEFVSLLEELKLEEDYLKLEQQRSQFSYTISVAENIDASLIDFPPLLLQPVLENSIRHAFGQELIHPEITIQIGSVGGNLEVKISDNGSTFWNSGKFQEGHGLSLTRKRMAVYNERLDGMSIQMELNYLKGSGTITTFTFHNWLA
jgi:hypothetical protein